MNFFDKINEYTSTEQTGAVEMPHEINENKENLSDTVADTSSDTSSESKKDAPNLNEMIESGEIQKSWTRVNTSTWCGCNNACFHSCYNIG